MRISQFAAASIAAAAILTSAAYAEPSHPVFGTFVNAGDVPAGSKLVVNITMKVTNDEDSGNAGYWALSSYNKVVKVWQVPDGSFYAVVRYTGQWTTFDGALSPGLGVEEPSDGSGTFEGGYAATFTAPKVTPASGYIGTFDLGGTKADVLLGTYGAGQTGPTTLFSWLDTYFPGYAGFNYVDWGWTYHYKSQAWYNYASGTTGDVVTGLKH